MEGDPFSVSAARSGGTDGAVDVDVVVDPGLSVEGTQTLHWDDGESGSQTANFTAALVNGDQSGDATLTDAGGLNGATIGSPAAVSVQILDSVSARYDMDDALADYPVGWTPVTQPTLPTTAGVDLEATNDTQLNDYLGNTAYNGRRIVVKSGGTFSPTAEHTLRGLNKVIEFEAGVMGVGRIPFAAAGDDPPSLIHAYGLVERANEIAWFGPLYSGGTYNGYSDILVDGLNIDINRDNPTWAPNDGQAWTLCNRIAYLNTYLGHMAYGFVLSRSEDIILANSWLARTSSAGSGGNKHCVRSEYSQRVAVVENKLDHSLDVPAAQSGAPVRIHYGSATGDSGGYQNSQHHFVRANAMEGRGNMQVKVHDSGDEGFSGRTVEDVLIELNSYRRVAQNPGQALITTGRDVGESGNVHRTAPIRYSFRNNRNYAAVGGNESDWLLTTEGGSVPADWGDMTGNLDGIAGAHTEFDTWAFQ